MLHRCRSLGRKGAFNVAIAAWVPCALLLFSLLFCMRKDEDKMQVRAEQGGGRW